MVVLRTLLLCLLSFNLWGQACESNTNLVTYHSSLVAEAASGMTGVMTGSTPVYILWWGDFTGHNKAVLTDAIIGAPTSYWWNTAVWYCDPNTGTQVGTGLYLAGQANMAWDGSTAFTKGYTAAGLLQFVVGSTWPAAQNAIYIVASAPSIPVAGWYGTAADHGAVNPVVYPWTGGKFLSFIEIPSPGGTGFGSLYSPNADSFMDTEAYLMMHELAEAVTDRNGVLGWNGGPGETEIADICQNSHQFKNQFIVGGTYANAYIGGRPYFLPEILANPQWAAPFCAASTGESQIPVVVWRPSNGTFYVHLPHNRPWKQVQWGLPGDTPFYADVDGDGIKDYIVWRPSNGYWFLQTDGGATSSYQWGLTGDTPISADFDGDGKTDLTVVRSNGSSLQWYTKTSGSGYTAFSITTFGFPGDILLPADYDGDGKADIAVFRPSNSTWYILRSSDSGVTTTLWGVSGDIPVPADFDGDHRTDPAVYRNGSWYVSASTLGGGTITYSWGSSSNIPVPMDYDLDGRADPAIIDLPSNTWWVGSSQEMAFPVQWGLPGDIFLH